MSSKRQAQAAVPDKDTIPEPVMQSIFPPRKVSLFRTRKEFREKVGPVEGR